MGTPDDQSVARTEARVADLRREYEAFLIVEQRAHGDPLTDSANRQVARHATRSAPARNRGRLRAQRIRTLRLAARLPLSLRRRAWRRRGGARAAGHFLYTDLRPRHLVADWESAIAEAPMALRSERVVNAEVLRGIEKNTHHWSLILLDRHQPAFLRRFGRKFAVAQGSQVYRDLQRGELSFRMYWFAKD